MTNPEPLRDDRVALVLRLVRATYAGKLAWRQVGGCEWAANLGRAEVHIRSRDLDDVAPYVLDVVTANAPVSEIESVFRPGNTSPTDEQLNALLRDLYEGAKLAAIAGDPGIRAAMEALNELGVDE